MGDFDPQVRQLPASRAQLLSCLDALGVNYQTVEHPAIFTVDEGRDLKKTMPGGHTKNLFLKDKKAALTLVVAHADTRINLVALGKRLGAKGRLSFGKSELMTATLGVVPGAVTPFTLMNDCARELSNVVIDTALMAFNRLWFHPLENTASTAISPADLVRFVENFGFAPILIDLASVDSA